MISEIIPETYDASGKKTTKLITKKHKYFFPTTFPVGRYLSQPLKVKCNNFEEIREFLHDCSYISDLEQFDQDDYWLPPEEFEKRRKGDCEDFSLWAWRQLIELGYTARIVVGRSGKFGEAHAWVTFQDKEKHFLLEPLLTFVKNMPQLSTVRYKPLYSCEWDGNKISYFKHEDRPFNNIGLFKLTTLFFKWALFWGRFWGVKLFQLFVVLPMYILLKIFGINTSKEKNA